MLVFALTGVRYIKNNAEVRETGKNWRRFA